jgi:lysophospholipase L1-like esterase
MNGYFKWSRFVVIAVMVWVVLSLVGQASAAGPAKFPAKVGYPNSLASTGDSITRAFNTCSFPFIDCPQNSWSTGTNSTVMSHYSRILAANVLIKGKNYNDAITGEMMSGLNGEITKVVSQHVDYVTILMGANDACTSTVAQMTSVTTYRAQLETALQTFSAGLPDSRIFVVSVPNVYQLWSVLHTNQQAANTWKLFKICQSMLANPGSTVTSDMQRRQMVLQRINDYNTQLQQACAEYIHCRFDNNAVFNTPFTASNVNTRDYFHPSISGQALLATVSYGASFNFADMTAPVSTSQVVNVSGGINVTLSATDSTDSVSGIEYQINDGSWIRYTGTVFVPAGSTITYRAVDSNGNVEASHTISA